MNGFYLLYAKTHRDSPRSLVSLFSSREKAEDYVKKSIGEENWCFEYKRDSLLAGYEGLTEIEFIPFDPEIK